MHWGSRGQLLSASSMWAGTLAVMHNRRVIRPPAWASWGTSHTGRSSLELGEAAASYPCEHVELHVKHSSKLHLIGRQVESESVLLAKSAGYKQVI